MADESAEFFSTTEKDLYGGIDTSVPHSARIWNYWLGGKDNFPVDRTAGDAYVAVFPGIVDIARLSRRFLARAVRYLAEEEGVRQFLDIGTGLPTVDNTHEVAQRCAPEAKIVYVDNDPLVLTHAHALLTGRPDGVTAYVEADLHDPETILERAAETLDLDRPVALMLMEILGHVPDDAQAQDIIRRLLARLSPGSFLVIADGTDTIPETLGTAQSEYDEGGSDPYELRGPDRILPFFATLDLLPPGLVPCPRWRPELPALTPAAPVQPLGAIARKP
ncbi:O-methyltransferase involved in polyketide biosynthesis [Actinocorallia herbida]|uniref:O-methyltransferase involved in polyketide biosynthesis n=1 Tax=Actinocorallia herbida TaxID=58109 RepID=A0A3N1D0T2_9ACTN|nr:SAM-dependent methyltransferase [Actinocorallia herbida]ROO87137.1 O-methyltransferase involved in polyketide biosynthesis [Actinocorallia herbida]